MESGVASCDGVPVRVAGRGRVAAVEGLDEGISLRDEAELASVLSHEIAHVVERHQVKAIKKEMGQAFATELAGEAAGRSDNTMVQMFGEKAFKAGTEIFVRGLDKGDEYQADVHGMVIAARGGYNPYALASVLQTLDGTHADDTGVAHESLSTQIVFPVMFSESSSSVSRSRALYWR